jgi:hypothetical protein
VPHISKDALDAAVEFALGAEIGLWGVVVDDREDVLEDEEPILERVLRRGPGRR